MSDQNRTQFTVRAVSLADFFNAAIGNRRVSGYKVTLAAPDGPSTGGGKQALQHISLVPDAGGATITAGSANQVEKIAELRTFDHLAQLHAKRFKGKRIPLDRVAYNELVKRMQTFFSDQRLTVVLLDAAQVQSQPSRLPALLMGVVVAAATAGAVFYFLNNR